MEKLADIGALRALIAVAESGSFAEGAHRLGLTRSAAGKAITRLEELLGTRLLHRTTRKVGLTTEGAVFLPRAAQIITDLEEAQAEFQRAGAEPQGTLRITATEAYGRQVILPIVAGFLARWPAVSAETQFTDRIINIVEEGYDVAVRFGMPTESSELIVRSVGQMVAQLYASPAYLERQGIPATPGELKEHHLLMNGSRSRPQTWKLRKGTESEVVVSAKPLLLSDNASAIRDAALGGLGIAFLPTFLTEKDVQEGKLQLVLPDYTSPAFPVCVVYPTRRQLSPRVRHFIDWLTKGLETSG
ncbi:LysR family transcriptional regulator [Pantoea sp. NGS-ED-1003]|uniref:LysR family transcriptional regulator n=1 Tax=Pantoea sp. NGS-ED-1003 TaxID=1526743 RepID=UPI0005343701|nr:LysR family transcriptional regulator [Pantoea sp. NGS-ED-1003]